MRAHPAYFSVGLGVLCVAGPLHAVHAEGAAVDAQPGLYRVGLGAPAPPTLAGTLGYGFTEPQGDTPGAHHRLSLHLAGAAALFNWLNVAPAVGFRYDMHPNDSNGVIDASLAARAFTGWKKLHLGGELKPWMPGTAQASTFLDTLSLDTRALFDVELAPANVALSVGYRLDWSAAAAGNSARLSPNDQLSLGVSSFNAVLLAAGTGVTFGPNEVFGELSGDLLVGTGAPGVADSPLRGTGGLRRALTSRLTAEVVADVC